MPDPIAPGAAPAGFRQLVAIAVPLTLGVAVIGVMQFTDRVFLGHLGPEALAASFPASMAVTLLQTAFVGAAGYAATFAAQHRGAGEPEEAGAMAWPAIWLAVAGGLVCAAAIPFLPAIFAPTRAEPAVRRDMAHLAGWLLAAAGPATLVAGLSGFFMGIGRAPLVFALNATMCALNAGLNAILVFGRCGLPHLGVDGAGIGTLSATTLTAAAAFALFLAPSHRRDFATWRRANLDRARLRRYLRFAAPQGLRGLVETSVWTVFFFATARFGTEAVALSNAVLAWIVLAYVPMVGLSQAIAVAVGRAVGAGDIAGARAQARRGVALELASAVLVAAPLLLAPDLMLAAFGERQDGHAHHLARELFAIGALWCLGDAAGFAYTGALGGAGDTRWTLGALAALSATLLLPPLIAVLAWQDRIAAWGIEPMVAAWGVTVCFVVVYSLALMLRFRSGRWMAMSVRR